VTYRSGDYTVYNDVICKLFEQRSEVPEPISMFHVCYESKHDYGFEGFEKHPFADMHCKSVPSSEIKNAFSVQTFGEYKGIRVKVFDYKFDVTIAYIITKDQRAFEKHSFLNMGDHYAQEVKATNLDKIWEERSKTIYDFPLPENLELYVPLKPV
jgi:hypothetical protein